MGTVVDPGFPVGGALTHWGGTNLRHVHFLAKTYVKMKEIDPVGGRAPAAPPGSANGAAEEIKEKYPNGCYLKTRALLCHRLWHSFVYF